MERSGEALLLTRASGESPPAGVGPIIGKDSLDWLGVPLGSPRGIIGALVVQSYSSGVRYTEKDKVLLEFVSIQVAAAIERKQTETWLQYVARHDQLTDLPNRELFHDRLRSSMARARREQTRMAVLYIDLDKFKEVNDSFGHDTGDLLLCEVARRINECVRESDTVARIGGDEFAVLLNSITLPEHASAVAGKIRRSLEQPFGLAGRQPNVSSSIGIAIYPEHGEEDRQLMRHADDAMYAAKRQGGNRVMLTMLQELHDSNTLTS